MERVAEPAPSLAWTTSSPPNWTPGTLLAVAKMRAFLRVRTLHKSIIFVGGDLESGSSLAEEGDDGLAGVTTDDGNLHGSGVLLAGELLGEGLGTHNVQGGHTEEALRVKDASGFEDLSGNRDGGVDRVGDNEDEGLGAELGDALGEVTDDAGVDLEEVITSHTRLACGVVRCRRDGFEGVGGAYGECRQG